MAKARQIESKAADEVRSGVISFTSLLGASETLAGTPTCASSPSGLTFSSVAYNSTSVTVNGATVTANRAIQFFVSGGTAGTLYTITATAPSTSDSQESLEMEANLEVT